MRFSRVVRAPPRAQAKRLYPRHEASFRDCHHIPPAALSLVCGTPKGRRSPAPRRNAMAYSLEMGGASPRRQNSAPPSSPHPERRRRAQHRRARAIGRPSTANPGSQERRQCHPLERRRAARPPVRAALRPVHRHRQGPGGRHRRRGALAFASSTTWPTRSPATCSTRALPRATGSASCSTGPSTATWRCWRCSRSMPPTCRSTPAFRPSECASSSVTPASSRWCRCRRSEASSTSSRSARSCSTPPSARFPPSPRPASATPRRRRRSISSPTSSTPREPPATPRAW